MDLFSKVIAVLLFAFPLAMLQSLESDLYDISEDDQIALNAIESVLLVKHADLTSYDDMDYKPVVDGQEDRTFDIIYNDVDYAANTISKYKQISIADPVAGTSKAQLFIDDCDKDEAALKWADGAVMEIAYGKKNYQLAYGESGLVREIKSTNLDGSLSVYQLQYTEDDKIESIKAKIDGRADFESKFEYTEAAISISKTDWNQLSYNNKSKPIFNQVSFIIEDLAITRIAYQENDKTKVVDMVEYIFNDQYQLVRKVASQPGKGITTILGFDYNENGQLLKSSRVDASIDSILNHSESLYVYQDDAEDASNLCDQKVNKIHSVYDEEGNLANTFKETSY